MCNWVLDSATPHLEVVKPTIGWTLVQGTLLSDTPSSALAHKQCAD
jgi:hypothetical protein